MSGDAVLISQALSDTLDEEMSMSDPWIQISGGNRHLLVSVSDGSNTVANTGEMVPDIRNIIFKAASQLLFMAIKHSGKDMLEVTNVVLCALEYLKKCITYNSTEYKMLETRKCGPVLAANSRHLVNNQRHDATITVHYVNYFTGFRFRLQSTAEGEWRHVLKTNHIGDSEMDGIFAGTGGTLQHAFCHMYFTQDVMQRSQQIFVLLQVFRHVVGDGYIQLHHQYMCIGGQ